MNLNVSKYKAFTLIEMLLVMVITIVLMGIGISYFSGMRTTIVMNQTNETLKQNFRWTQRAAILLKRDPGENWLYGIGVDLTELYSNNTYRIFKWCSPFEEYGDDPKTEGSFPNFAIGDSLSDLNVGNIPHNLGYPDYLLSSEKCDQNYVIAGSPTEGKLLELPNQGTGAIGSDRGDFSIRIPDPLRVGYQAGITAVNRPVYVLYESGSGNVYMYNSSGHLINYDVATNQLVATPIDLEFVVVTADGSKGTSYTLSYNSGRVTTQAIIEELINANFVFAPPLGSDLVWDTRL